MRDVFVAGVGMTEFGRFPDTSIERLGVRAISAALQDAGIPGHEVEVAYAGHARTGRLQGRENGVGQLCCWAAGIREIPILGVGNFCASGSSALREAWMAVGSGLYDVGLAFGVEQLTRRTEGGQPLTADGMELEGRLGFTPPAFFALAAHRYMDTIGLERETLAKIAVKNRAHAHLNPLAQYRKLTTVEEVLASPMVVDPFTRLSSCPTSDGGAAAVVVSRDAAERFRIKRLVRIAASALTSGGYGDEDLAHMEIDRRASRLAYEQAGFGPDDLDVAEVHDAFTFCELMHYEDLGFCAPGEAARLVDEGVTSLGGRLPVSVSGGLLSRGHALGATGIAQAVEVVNQLRGEAGARQVAGARTGLIHCVGGFVGNDNAASAVHLLQAAG
jgi:acetyl-CoA acetyltransferase